MKTKKAKFEKVDSGIKGITAWKPNAAMQKEIAESMPADLLKAFPKWAALKKEK